MSEITTVISVDSKGGYTATPEDVTVTKGDVTLVYQLDRESESAWEITGLTTSDSQNQAGPWTIGSGGRSISFVDANTVNETFNVYIELAHRQSGKALKIDPEVRNIPPA